MICVELTLLTPTTITNSIGVQTQTYSEEVVPIIKVEDIYSNEFYQANEQGLKPSLRVKISSLNYNNQEELLYNGVHYSVIRTSTPNIDEVVLICERKVKNIWQPKSV